MQSVDLFSFKQTTMSAVDEVEAAATDSFWEIDQFRHTVKRVDDGLHMCQEVSRMIAERAEIEHDYAKKLQAWSKKWNEVIEKGFFSINETYRLFLSDKVHFIVCNTFL